MKKYKSKIELEIEDSCGGRVSSSRETNIKKIARNQSSIYFNQKSLNSHRVAGQIEDNRDWWNNEQHFGNLQLRWVAVLFAGNWLEKYILIKSFMFAKLPRINGFLELITFNTQATWIQCCYTRIIKSTISSAESLVQTVSWRMLLSNEKEIIKSYFDSIKLLRSEKTDIWYLLCRHCHFLSNTRNLPNSKAGYCVETHDYCDGNHEDNGSVEIIEHLHVKLLIERYFLF